MLVRLAIFTAIIGAAFIFDYYFESDAEDLKNIESKSDNHHNTSENVYIVAQTNQLSVKSSVPKSQVRKIQIKSYEKLRQQYHQLRNYQVLKAEVQTQTTPLISTYHYLVFQNHFVSQPDDDDSLSA